eukprot:UN22792
MISQGSETVISATGTDHTFSLPLLDTYADGTFDGIPATLTAKFSITYADQRRRLDGNSLDTTISSAKMAVIRTGACFLDNQTYIPGDTLTRDCNIEICREGIWELLVESECDQCCNL